MHACLQHGARQQLSIDISCHRALSSKPAATAVGRRDRRTDRRTDVRLFTDAAPDIYYSACGQILRVSWSARKTNEWVFNTAGVKRELSDTVKAKKLAYYGHTMRKQGSCLGKKIMQGTMPGARRRGRPRTAWMDNIKTWTGLSVEESIRMTEDRDKWGKYVHGVANPRIEDG